MNGTTGAPPAWSGAEQFDMAAAEHDFSNLLDFDLDFSDFANGSSAGHGGQQLEQLAEELDVQHLHNPFSPQLSQQQQHQHQQHQHQHQQHRNGARTPGALQPQRHMDAHSGGHPHSMPTQNGFFQFSMPFQQHCVPAFTQAPDMFQPHAPVPPTPNSMELHGDPARYLQQMDAQHAMFDQRFQMPKDESFTPLVSPAVTPHEPCFQVHEMTTVPGAYFSPLTSPALNAQNYSHAHAHSSHYGTTSGSSTGASPDDVDMDMLEEPAISQTSQSRKVRSTAKRSAPTRFSAAPVRVRQSPIVKPARRKATVSSLIPPKEVTDLLEEERAIRPSSSGADLRRSRESSESDSISPGPLSEMGPPPKPNSLHPSPAVNAQAFEPGVAPATPASLMRIHPSPTFGDADAPPALDDLTLPEASLDRPPLSRLDTAIRDDDQETPRPTARKTPKLGPLSTPSSASVQSGKPSPSPMLSAVSSPTSPAFFSGTSRKADLKSARSSKKRNSVTSTLISPALRPKISPSIKPLLPDGSVSGDTHALLLASKSNYQNILDGTVVPGVSYPTSLSTNLTSKRTSHKIAEQGRRNRINTALQEMQALVPSPHLGAKESKSPESMTAAQLNNSKAAKVESAIDYIKALQAQCSEKDKQLDKKDQELQALRKELAALKRSSSTGGASSADTALQSTEQDAT
ncbi:hypothetical protein PMIN06_000575 [Paraphaeosphaeria minitans]|uniref:Helix-loop-helix DNA-binding domain-containing protein n=1 Tax=Paraphaeosphaeria minitans TaxID=565426 RepID=A0A9P6KR01_9PLEO|nr:helix-loop-helix DNA-binding domain-containing protein [Paraphaeosphaeria minitans]